MNGRLLLLIYVGYMLFAASCNVSTSRKQTEKGTKDTLVLQIRSDSTTVCKPQEETLQSKEFNVEPVRKYTQKELNAIQDKLDERWMAMANTPVMRNVTGAGVYNNNIEINLIVNTPEKRREFRKHVMDSPAFRFTGSENPVENATIGVNDTLGISLRPQYPVYSADCDSAIFILYNSSGDLVRCGERYFVTYEDSKGVWRELPINNNFNDVAHRVPDGSQRECIAYLYPDLHPNLPGRYRFFYKVTLGPPQKRTDLLMMAEFRLSDNKNFIR